MRIACVVGARPNFMKIAPVARALEDAGVPPVVIHTGQHYDREMSSVFFEDLGMAPPAHSLDIGSGTHAEQTGWTMIALEPLLQDLSPDVVVVVGDVNSTLAGALVAAKMDVRLAHVEAGLRSRDSSMPEEVNRIVTDRLSSYLFAPSREAVDNLLQEGIERSSIHFVGNVMIDSLIVALDKARGRTILRDLDLEPRSYGLVTLHRASNVDDEDNLQEVMEGLAVVARRLPLIFPIHPRTRARLAGAPVPSALRIVDPLGYLDFLALEAEARLVITDSGGVQEETTYLGVPCLTFRANTERPVTVTEGTNTVIGSDPSTLGPAASKALDEPKRGRIPELWDGRSGERIATALLA